MQQNETKKKKNKIQMDIYNQWPQCNAIKIERAKKKIIEFFMDETVNL